MDLLGKLKCCCYSSSTESQHHYSLISLRDFTISLQFPQNLDITPVSGTCQSPFTQLRTVKLICKLNESPETCQEYLPQGQAAGDAQQRSLLCPCFPLCPFCQLLSTVCQRGHLMKNGSYLFQSGFAPLPTWDHWDDVLLSSPEPLQMGKGHRKTDFPQNITCFYGVCYSHPGEGGYHFLQWKGIGKKASLLQPENLLCIARNSQELESLTNLFSSCYKNDNDDKLPGLDEVCRELHKPHPGCSRALLIWGQKRFHVLFVNKQETGGATP